MMQPVARMHDNDASAVAGRVVWSPAKSLWNMSMLACAIVFAPVWTTPSAVLLFIATTYCSLLLGHSVGMHRRFIHRSYDCRKWLERTLVYVGVLVGVAGPFGILRVHDERDWAQRQDTCHDFFAHRRSPFVDLFWQLNCRFRFDRPPRFAVEPEFADDPWYRFLQRTWMLQQLPIALACYALGGRSWLVWGVAVRVCISVIGHWSITYWCHNPGPGRWHVKGAAVQASNLRGLGLLTYGECWHNNHHAFPESARIGLERDQADPAARIIEWFAKLGWAWNLGTPRPATQREDLVDVSVPG
ncbi:MAG TPA: fatty acid desaturase [Steroidobacteraceae bacterium]|jgi:stearoyl-CoA desaturase (delta-9 desaturase)